MMVCFFNLAFPANMQAKDLLSPAKADPKADIDLSKK
jgi:hypothetical protein